MAAGSNGESSANPVFGISDSAPYQKQPFLQNRTAPLPASGLRKRLDPFSHLCVGDERDCHHFGYFDSFNQLQSVT